MADLTNRLGSARSSLGFKAPCVVATTATIALTGTQTIDGVAVVAEDRVLVKSQTTASENGIWVCKTRTWERARDWNSSSDVATGTLVLVHSGSAASGVWRLTTSGPIIIGTTAVTFSRIFDVSDEVTARDTLGFRAKYVTDYGAIGDGVTNDTIAIQAAFDDLVATDTLVFPSGSYRTNGVITCTTDGINIHLENCRFLIGDTGTSGTISDNGSGKIGYLLKDITSLQITGSAKFIGLGTSGVTSLAGLVIDTCSDVRCPATLYFETMACGLWLQVVSRSSFGDCIGNDIDGLQTFEDPPTNTAGSLQVINGCDNVTLGDAIATDIDKPVRYFTAGTGTTSNKHVTCGSTIVTGITNSDLAHGLGIRSALDCHFGPVIARGTAIQAVLVVQYSGDQALGFEIDRVYIESITGISSSTPASVDSIIAVTSQGTAAVGTITVGSIDAVCDAFSGIHVTGGSLIVGSARLTGAADRQIYLAASEPTHKPYLSIEHLTIVEPSGPTAPINIGRQGRARFGRIELDGGPYTNAAPAIRYDATIGPDRSTVTMTIASPCVVTWTAHGQSDGDPVIFTTTSALPTGLTAGTVYYIVNSTTNTFQVAATAGEAAINTSGSQSGTHTATIGVLNGHYGVEIGSMEYNQNGTAGNYADLITDAEHGAESWRIGHIEGIGSTASPVILGNADRFFYKHGKVMSSAAPTVGTYTRGFVVWNTAPSTTSGRGWVCVTAGTPGTWDTLDDPTALSAWTASTPTPTSVGGAFTTATSAIRVLKIGKTVHVKGIITLTTIGGTASGRILLTMPYEATEGVAMAGVNRSTLQAAAAYMTAASTALQIEPPTAFANGHIYSFGGTYETI